MTKETQPIIFDVDGVLLDTLNPHLSICSQKNEEYGLGLSIPDAKTFKNEIVRKDVKISPMYYFFTAVGFPEENAKKADLYYQEYFSRDYQVSPFEGIIEMIGELHGAGHSLGIVTSNNVKNIQEPLKSVFDIFGDCVFAHDSHPNLSKAEAISEAAELLKTNVASCTYVGDQPKDFEAATLAGSRFVGVAYGWGLSEEDSELVIAKDVPSLKALLMRN